MSSLFRKILHISQTWYKSNTSLGQWDGSARWRHLLECHPKSPLSERRHACTYTHTYTYTPCAHKLHAHACAHMCNTYTCTHTCKNVCTHTHTRKDRINFMLITQVYSHTSKTITVSFILHLCMHSTTSLGGHGLALYRLGLHQNCLCSPRTPILTSPRQGEPRSPHSEQQVCSDPVGYLCFLKCVVLKFWEFQNQIPCDYKNKKGPTVKQ